MTLSEKSLSIIFMIMLPLLHNVPVVSMASFNDSARFIQEIHALKKVPLEQIPQVYPAEQVTYMTGLKYVYGLGVERDSQKGFSLIFEAAQTKLSAAQRAVGIAYYEGYGVPVDKKEAFKWLKIAALNGDPYALEELFVMPSTDRGKNNFCEVPEWKSFVEDKKNQTFLIHKAKTGELDAQFALANLRLQGEIVPKDEAWSIKQLLALSEKLYPPAQYLLAQCYRQGIGITRDPHKAFELLQKAAPFSPSARADLASMQMEKGMPYTNIVEGKKVLEEFCNKGDGKACSTLAMSYVIPDDNNEPDYDKAFDLFQKAYALGDTLALYYLAILSAQGFGPDAGPEQADKFYQKILSSQNPDLDVPKGIIYEMGTAKIKPDIKKAKKFYERAGTAPFARNRLQAIALQELANELGRLAAPPQKNKKKGKAKATTEPDELEQAGEPSSCEPLIEPDIDIAGHVLKEMLNKQFTYDDGSIIRDIDTVQKIITIYNPYNNSTVTIALRELKPISQKEIKRLQKYTYAQRVRDWFNPKKAQERPVESVYRHQFAQRVDEIAQLYGTPAYFFTGNDSIKNTILECALQLDNGTVLAGVAEFTVNDKGELYHRFINSRTRTVVRQKKSTAE